MFGRATIRLGIGPHSSSQIFPTINSLPALGLTPRLYDWSVSSEHLGFLFLVFFISLFFVVVPCGRLS